MEGAAEKMATNAAGEAAQKMAQETREAVSAVFQHEQLEELKADLIQALHHESYDWNWVLALLLFGAIVGVVMMLKKTILGWLDKQSKKTDNEVDDFLITVVQKWYVRSGRLEIE